MSEKGLFADKARPSDSDNEHMEFEEGDNYLAWNKARGNSSVNRLDIRRNDDTGSIIYYAYLATIEYSGDNLITLLYQDSAVVIQGKNLRELRAELQNERVHYIQQIKPGTSHKDDQSVITSINWMKPTRQGEEEA
jgi:hypothetical protein